MSTEAKSLWPSDLAIDETSILNDKSLEECLSMIGINSVSEFKERIKNSIQSFMQLLDDIYSKDNNRTR